MNVFTHHSVAARVACAMLFFAIGWFSVAEAETRGGESPWNRWDLVSNGGGVYHFTVDPQLGGPNWEFGETPSQTVVPTGSPTGLEEILWISTDLGIYHDGQNWLGGAAPTPLQAALFDGDTTDIVPIVFDASASNMATIVRAGNFEFRTFDFSLLTPLLTIDGRARSSDAVLTIDAGDSLLASRVEVVSDFEAPNGSELNILNGNVFTDTAVVFGGTENNPAAVNLSAPWTVTDTLFVGGDELLSDRHAVVDSNAAGGILSVGRQMHLWEDGALSFAGSSTPAYAVVGTGPTEQVGGNVYVTSNGLLSGDGIIRRASVHNEGLVRIADFGTTGRLTIDGTGQSDFDSNYVQRESGHLEMDIGGLQEIVEHDQLHIATGGALLGGVLDLNVLEGFTPQIGDEVVLVSLGGDATGVVGGSFDGVRAYNLADVDPNLAVDVLYSDNAVTARFVATSTEIQYQESSPVSNWVNSENWTTGESPTSLNPIVVKNTSDSPRRVEVAFNESPGSMNAFVHRLEVSGELETMTIAVDDEAFLSSTTHIRLDDKGRIDLEGGTVVATQLELAPGGALLGDGMVVADVISDGRIAPGNSPGALRIDGDLETRSRSVIDIEIGGPPDGGEFDTIDVTGDIAIDGDLIVSIIDLIGNGASGVYEPNVGDRFEIVRTADGSIVGQFANFVSFGLPSTIAWELSIDSATGESGSVSVSITAVETLPGDFDGDGDVDEDDFMAWQVGYGALSGAAREEGDADGDGDVDGDDFLAWQSNFGASVGGAGASVAVPEPSAWTLCYCALLLYWYNSRRHDR